MAKELNIPLAVQVLAQITKHPESHDQRQWVIEGNDGVCGTAHCVAGWALHFADRPLRPLRRTTGDAWWTGATAEIREPDGTWSNVGPERIEKEAREALGIGRNKAEALFTDEQSDEEARALLAKYIAKALKNDALV